MYVVISHTASSTKKGMSSIMLDGAVAFEAQRIGLFGNLGSTTNGILRNYTKMASRAAQGQSSRAAVLTVQLFSGSSTRFRCAVAAIPVATTRSACINLSPTRVAS